MIDQTYDVDLNRQRESTLISSVYRW